MIISLKSSASGSSRGLVHYLAHSKLDREQEGIEQREFFSESENDLDVRGTNRHLSLKDTKPKPEELLHIVIAPSKDEIESLGDDRAARKDALKAVVRETVARLENEVKARNLKWVAVSHFNTDNPHAHLAIQKQFLSENGKTEILRINRQMLHYNEVVANGEKKLHKGALILAAENKIKEIAEERRTTRENEKVLEPKKTVRKSEYIIENNKRFSAEKALRIPNFSERRILAEEMLVAAEIIRRERNIENLIEHGDKKRFKIKDDVTGNTRHVSLFDIERKIAHLRHRKARLTHPKNVEKRAELAAKFSQEERAKHTPLIQQLETIRLHVLGFENRHLTQAREKHTRLHDQKLLIEKKYERLKTAVALPLFNADEIQGLQSEAFREQNLEKILLLESIRQCNAAELNRPSRRERDVRELLAAKIVAELKIQAAEKRLGEFPANKDFVKVKIGDSVWSHRELDRHEFRAARKNDLWTLVKSKTSELLIRSDKKTAFAEKLDYPALHKAVEDALENLENARRDEIKQQKEFSQILNKIFEAETNPNKTKLTPAFSAYELSEAEDLALVAGRENFYENALVLQENWLREKLAENLDRESVSKEQQTAGKIRIQKHASPVFETAVQFQSESESQVGAERIIGKFVLGRAEARSLIARTNTTEAQENLDRYNRDKLFVKHRITDPKTGAERELTLRDVEPKKHYYLLDRVLEKALESQELKNLRDAVHQAALNKEKELTKNLKDAQHRVLRLENQKTMMLEKYSAAPGEIQPIFTPKEIAALDIRAARTLDKSEADRLEKIVDVAEKNNTVARIQDLLDRTAKEFQLLTPSLTKKTESKISHENDSIEQRQAIGQSREISVRSANSETSLSASHNNAGAETIEHEKAVVKEKARIR